MKRLFKVLAAFIALGGLAAAAWGWRPLTSQVASH